VRTSITGNSGKRSNAIATKANTATTAIDNFLRNGHATFTAIDTSRPAAAAAKPANRWRMCTSLCVR
jgi:hypothetical protein